MLSIAPVTSVIIAHFIANLTSQSSCALKAMLSVFISRYIERKMTKIFEESKNTPNITFIKETTHLLHPPLPQQLCQDYMMSNQVK